MSSNPISAGSLAIAQNRIEERRLKSAFLRCMAALPSRPEPRSRFDEQARRRDDRKVLHPGHRAVDLCRILLAAAVRTGNRDTINATRRQIAHYFDDMKASALREVIAHDETSFEHVIISFHKESCEALTAAAVAAVEESDSAKENLLREAREAEAESARLIECLSAELAVRQGRRHLAVVSR